VQGQSHGEPRRKWEQELPQDQGRSGAKAPSSSAAPELERGNPLLGNRLPLATACLPPQLELLLLALAVLKGPHPLALAGV
jgi:hypothetical protein